MFNDSDIRILSYLLDMLRKSVNEKYLSFCKISPNDINTKHYKSIVNDIDNIKEKLLK